MTNNKHIYVVTGAAGSGKSRLTYKVAKQLRMQLGLVTTDRPYTAPARYKYINTDKETFTKQTFAVTYTDTEGYHCGITEEELENSDIFAVDYNAVRAFREQYRGDREPVFIGIAAIPEDRREYMLKSDAQRDTEALLALGQDISSRLLTECDSVILNDGPFGTVMLKLQSAITCDMYAHDPDIEKLAYDTFCTEWLMERGITVKDIVDRIAGMVAEAYGEDETETIAAYIWSVLEGMTFRGETLLPMKEFLRCEYEDTDFRTRLINRMHRRYHSIDLKLKRRQECKLTESA